MKDYKVKAEVIADFNDSKNGGKHYEANEPIILSRARYEELFSKGFVKNGEKVKEEKKPKNENQD